jgi:hypothetical protein
MGEEAQDERYWLFVQHVLAWPNQRKKRETALYKAAYFSLLAFVLWLGFILCSLLHCLPVRLYRWFAEIINGTVMGLSLMNIYLSTSFLQPPRQDKKLLEQLVGSDPALFRRIFLEIPTGFDESEERWRRLVWSYLEDIASPKLTAGALQGLQGRLQLTDYFHVNRLCQILSLVTRGAGSELTLLFGQAKRELAAEALQGYQALAQHEKGEVELARMEQLRAHVMEHERRRRKRKIATFGVANLCTLGFWAFCSSVVYSHMFPRLMETDRVIPSVISGVVEIGTFTGKLKPADKNLLERAVRDHPSSLLLLLANAAPSYQRSDRWRDAVFRFVAAGQDTTLNKLFLEALRGT